MRELPAEGRLERLRPVRGVDEAVLLHAPALDRLELAFLRPLAASEVDARRYPGDDGEPDQLARQLGPCVIGRRIAQVSQRLEHVYRPWTVAHLEAQSRRGRSTVLLGDLPLCLPLHGASVLGEHLAGVNGPTVGRSAEAARRLEEVGAATDRGDVRLPARELRYERGVTEDFRGRPPTTRLRGHTYRKAAVDDSLKCCGPGRCGGMGQNAPEVSPVVFTGRAADRGRHGRRSLVGGHLLDAQTP